jgi:hypothetical protein
VRAAAVIGLACVAMFAAPAHAAVVAERLAAVGPVLDGDAVTWGEGGRGADVSIHTLRADGSIIERWRRPADQRRRHTLMWGQYPGVLAASPSWLAFYTFDEHVLEADGDSVALESTDTLWLGRAGEAPQPRSQKVGPPRCRHVPEVTGVAVDGPRLAWAEARLACSRRALWRPRVSVLDGATRRLFRLRAGNRTVRRVRLAGRYLGWSTDEQGSDTEINVRDLERGRVVLRLRGKGSGFRDFGDFDLQPDGTVVALASRRLGRYSSQGFVVTASPQRPRLRVLADDAYGGPIQAAAGRAVYVREKDYFTDGLVLVSLTSPDEKRTLATWTRQQQLAGSFDFDGRRLAYGVADVPEPDDTPPTAAGRIVVEDVAA